MKGDETTLLSFDVELLTCCHHAAETFPQTWRHLQQPRNSFLYPELDRGSFNLHNTDVLKAWADSTGGELLCWGANHSWEQRCSYSLLEFWPKLRLCFFKNVSCIFKDFLNFCVFEEQLFWLFHCFLLFSLPSHWHSSWVGLYSTQTHMTRWTSWRTVRTLLRTWCSTTWNATRMKSRKFW